ncbi:hypothetical protein DSBG_1953 [Desulfosporosinus sp. BG]|nr:hypothetical protein DSBG_1953 [Desulfosporosinus sp. BG]
MLKIIENLNVFIAGSLEKSTTEENVITIEDIALGFIAFDQS